MAEPEGDAPPPLSPGLRLARSAAVGLLVAVPAALANVALADQDPKPIGLLNLTFLVMAIGFFLALTGVTAGIATGVGLIVIGILLFMVGALLISTMKGIFSVVLFRYAQDGTVEGGFTEPELAGAIRTTR